ncbi:Retrovirus-related Pol polyprotein from type-2 retrotransposable element R2DM, partial [Symbiodinium microadriaticum]
AIEVFVPKSIEESLDRSSSWKALQGAVEWGGVLEASAKGATPKKQKSAGFGKINPPPPPVEIEMLADEGAEQIWEGCKRFSNPDHQVPLDYINLMLWSSYYPKLDLLKEKLLPSAPRAKDSGSKPEAEESTDDVGEPNVKKIKIQEAREHYRKIAKELFGHSPMEIDDSDEERHDQGVEADVKDERAFLSAATASDDAGLPGGLEAPPADDLEEPAAETGDGKEKAAEAGDGQEKAADGKEKPAPKAPKVTGKASGSNFAGRTPPNTPPYSTRFQCCKKIWVEKIHPQIKPGHYQKSQVHWWKYVLANMDLAVCGTDQEIETRVDELMGTSTDDAAASSRTADAYHLLIESMVEFGIPKLLMWNREIPTTGKWDALDLFSGTGLVKESLCSLGFSVSAHDIERHPSMDINSSVRDAPTRVFHMGVDESPQLAEEQLLGRENPLGRTELPNIADANRMVARTALMMLLIHWCGGAWILEQPASSLMHGHPAVAAALLRCQYFKINAFLGAYRFELFYKADGTVDLWDEQAYDPFLDAQLYKVAKYLARSGIEGQDQCNLWITKDRSIEVFVGQRRMLKNMDNGQEPTAYDQVIEVTGKPKEELQQMTLGLEVTRPQESTWANTGGASSRIDFILFALPSMISWDDRVIQGSDHIIGSDHNAVSVSLQSMPSTGREARDLAKQIADTRKRAKKEWLAALLEKSAQGDFRAIAYFKKRNTAMYTQGSYCIRAGGRTKAIADLRAFYHRKYTPQELPLPGLPRAIFHARAGPILNPIPFSIDEIRDVAFMCKHNKSTGDDGISYEALQMLLQSELADHVLDMYNGVLLGLLPIPKGWLHSHVCFLPKTTTPQAPADLRPIVLSSTVAKVFTKALMLRLRPQLPEIGAFQVGGVPQRQILDAACAVQQAVRLSEQYGKPLVIIKLDVAAAFDSLSHEALASYLAKAQGSREAEALLDVICNSQVGLGLQGTSWDQPLRQGVLQGSSYSAELFARCVDFYMSFTNSEWQQREDTWLQTQAGRKLFLTPFADDLVLLATSREQAGRLLQDTVKCLGAIGLKMNWKKCRYVQTPGFPKTPLTSCGADVQWTQSFIFLGILIGFQLSCHAVLAARMTKEVDLKGCQLVQNGDFFTLLHTRHPPVEEPTEGNSEESSSTSSLTLLLRIRSRGGAGPRDVREHVQAFMDSARPVAVIPSGSIAIGVGLLLLFGWGALTSFLRGLVTTMQTTIRTQLIAVLQELNEETRKTLQLEIGNATEKMQRSLTTRLEDATTTKALQSQVNEIQASIQSFIDAPRESLSATSLAEELWDSLRPVLTQWTQVQGDKQLKILQDWIDGTTMPSSSTASLQAFEDKMKELMSTATAPISSSVSTQALEDKMKELHATVMSQLQDLHGAVTTTTLSKVDSLTTKVDSVAAKAETQAGYMREDHAILVRVRDRVDEVSKECLGHRSAVLAEIKNHYPIIRDTQKVATRAAEMAERTSVLLGKGDPSPWETELKDRTHKIESMLTGMLDVVNDVGTALERHSESMGMRLRVLNDVQGGLDKVLTALAARAPMPSAPSQPPHFAQHGGFARRVPPAPTHSPTIVEDFSGQQPVVQTQGHTSTAPPVLVTNLDALTQVLNQRSGYS